MTLNSVTHVYSKNKLPGESPLLGWMAAILSLRTFSTGDTVSTSLALLIMDCIDLSLHWREEKVQSPNQNIGPWCPWHRQPGLHVVLPLAFQKPAEEGEGLSAPLSMLSHGIVSRAVWRITRLSASSCKVLDQTSWLHKSSMVLKCPFWFWQLCVGLCAHRHVCASAHLCMCEKTRTGIPVKIFDLVSVGVFNPNQGIRAETSKFPQVFWHQWHFIYSKLLTTLKRNISHPSVGQYLTIYTPVLTESI